MFVAHLSLIVLRSREFQSQSVLIDAWLIAGLIRVNYNQRLYAHRWPVLLTGAWTNRPVSSIDTDAVEVSGDCYKPIKVVTDWSRFVFRRDFSVALRSQGGETSDAITLTSRPSAVRTKAAGGRCGRVSRGALYGSCNAIHYLRKVSAIAAQSNLH